MKHKVMYGWAVLLSLLTCCKTGTRDIDFESKQFTATYNVDSTRGIDTTNMDSLKSSKKLYSFSKEGKGTNHIQMGLLSKDTPFAWEMQGDSLRIDDKLYAVVKQDQGFILKSDSAKIILSQQP